MTDRATTGRAATPRAPGDGPRTRGGWTPAGTAARRRVAQAERGTSRGQRTRQEILDAARAVFSRRGYLDAAISDIVAEAGLARGSFYTYFPSKLEVFKVLAAEVGEAIAAAVTPEPGERGLDPVAALDRSNRRYLHAYRRNAAIYGLIEQTASIDPELRRLRQHYRDLHVQRVAARITSWQRRGLAAAAVDPATAAAALVSMTSNFCYWWHVLGERHDAETAAATLTALWAGSLGLRAGPGARPGPAGPAEMTGPGQDPPEVTRPEPELADGAVPELRPLALPELPELPAELPELPAELPELPELCAELREPELLVPVLAAECCAALACAEPGSARLTPAAASTLAAPAAAVTARSLDWLRFLAAIAACRSGLLCAVILVLSPMSPESRIGGEFLGTLCGGCEIPLVVRQARLLPGRGGGRPRPGSAGSSLASPRR